MSDNTSDNINAPSAFLNMMEWRCPVCRRIPLGDIYQCPDGHSFCENCMLFRKNCPECDVKIFGSSHGSYTVRNRLAEYLLNQMKFECHWKGQGCQTLETRHQLHKHECGCIFGPIFLCSRFSGSAECNFKTFLFQTLNVNTIINHVQAAHGHFIVKTLNQFGSVCNVNLGDAVRKQLESRTENYFIPVFVEVVNETVESLAERSKELFIFLRKVEVSPQGDVTLSWLPVWLSCGINRKNFTVKMNMMIKARPRPQITAENTNDSVPDLNWTMEPVKAPEFAKWMVCTDKKLDFPFSLPLSHINQYYVDSDDIFTASFSFLKEYVI